MGLSVITPGLAAARRFAGASKAFTPADVSGLVVWLRADALGLNDGDPVGTWTDGSGNGRDLTQATAAKKPTYKTNIVNGKPVVRFDGVDDRLKAAGFTWNQPEHVLAVLK